MTDQEITERIVRAQSMGFAHTFTSKGYPEEFTKAATTLYAEPNNGLLQKRASRAMLLHQIRANILEKVAANRSVAR